MTFSIVCSTIQSLHSRALQGSPQQPWPCRWGREFSLLGQPWGPTSKSSIHTGELGGRGGEVWLPPLPRGV